MLNVIPLTSIHVGDRDGLSEGIDVGEGDGEKLGLAVVGSWVG